MCTMSPGRHVFEYSAGTFILGYNSEDDKIYIRDDEREEGENLSAQVIIYSENKRFIVKLCANCWINWTQKDKWLYEWAVGKFVA